MPNAEDQIPITLSPSTVRKVIGLVVGAFDEDSISAIICLSAAHACFLRAAYPDADDRARVTQLIQPQVLDLIDMVEHGAEESDS